MASQFPPNIYEVSQILSTTYENNHHYNKKNPVNELLFILCSVKTTENLYQKTYLSLKKRFPKFKDVLCSPTVEIAKAIEFGGLSNQKANSIKKIFKKINADFGVITLSSLKKLSNEDCEKYLASLPGVGKKVALCVMMYSLGREVFPVDTHCWRICKRLGWVRPTRSTKTDGTCSIKDMKRLQDKIPPELRFKLHVNFISLGREFCTSRKVFCEDCPIRDQCKKIGTMDIKMREQFSHEKKPPDAKV